MMMVKTMNNEGLQRRRTKHIFFELREEAIAAERPTTTPREWLIRNGFAKKEREPGEEG